MKKVMAVIGFIVVFLLAVAGLVALFLHFTGMSGNLVFNDKPTPTPNQVISSPEALVTPTPEQVTPTPEITPTPEVVTPTPVPTPTPQPVGMNVGSGTFSSDTGVYINIDANWEAVTLNESQVEVTVDVKLKTYSLHIPDKNEGLVITLGDQSKTLATEVIDTSTESEDVLDLGKHTFTVDAQAGQAKILPLKVVWNFGGTYSGQTLETIEAGGDITIKR